MCKNFHLKIIRYDDHTTDTMIENRHRDSVWTLPYLLISFRKTVAYTRIKQHSASPDDRSEC